MKNRFRLFAGLLAVLWLCAPYRYGAAHEIKIPRTVGDISIAKITDRIHVIHGIQSLPNRDNQGAMSNSGIVLTDAGVVLVDAGGSLVAGRLIVEKIRELTEKPVIAVFNTHMHGDHWLGNAAVREAFPDARIYAHERAIERLRAGEADEWINMFGRILGPEAAGTEAVIPDEAVQGGETLELGGATFKMHYAGQGHTDNDLMIEWPADKLLFTGDVADNEGVPSVGMPHDFSAQGQIKALRYALALPIDIYVPGHGATAGREAPEGTLRLLEQLYASVERHYKAGLMDFEMKDKVVADLAEFANWDGFDRIGVLISHIYLQVEEADFQ